jgi:hypothetical protein
MVLIHMQYFLTNFIKKQSLKIRVLQDCTKLLLNYKIWTKCINLVS